MKRAKKRRPAFFSRPAFVMFLHSQLTAEDLFVPADPHAKLIEGQLFRLTGIRFVETAGGANG